MNLVQREPVGRRRDRVRVRSGVSILLSGDGNTALTGTGLEIYPQGAAGGVGVRPQPSRHLEPATQRSSSATAPPRAAGAEAPRETGEEGRRYNVARLGAEDDNRFAGAGRVFVTASTPVATPPEAGKKAVVD